MNNSLTSEIHLEYGAKLQLCFDFTDYLGGVFNHHYGHTHPVNRLGSKAYEALWNMKDGLNNLVRYENRNLPASDMDEAYSRAKDRLSSTVPIYQPDDDFPPTPIPLSYEAYLQCGARFQLCIDFIFHFAVLLSDVYGSNHKVTRLGMAAYKVLRQMKTCFDNSFSSEHCELLGPDWDEIYRCPKSFMSITDPLHLLKIQGE